MTPFIDSVHGGGPAPRSRPRSSLVGGGLPDPAPRGVRARPAPLVRDDRPGRRRPLALLPRPGPDRDDLRRPLETSLAHRPDRPLPRRHGRDPRSSSPSRTSSARARSAGEFYALLLWGHVGVSLMTRGLDLLIIFIGLETLSLSFYVLAGFFRRVAASSEAGLKYFLTGAFGSAFTLYGIALLFGAAAAPRISDLVASGRRRRAPPSPSGSLFLLVGFGFKMSLAPFHAWAPDVYQGMPTPAVAYLSVAPKGASRPRPLPRASRAAFEGGVAGPLPRRARRARDPLDDARQRRRARAARRQAPARLLRHRAHGLRHDRARRLRPRSARGGHRLSSSPTSSRTPAPSRPSRPSTATRRSRTRSRLLAGEGRRAPFAAARPRALPLLARRHPGDRRIHRQVLRLQGRARARASTRSRSSASSTASCPSATT